VATTTQHNPNAALNARLNQAGASKTIYALVTPETEATKAALLGNADPAGADPARAAYLEQFRDAWTAKQDALHEAFFDTWHEWSAPLVDLDRGLYPFAYPTAGASEPLRHLIYAYGNMARRDGFVPRVHVFKGEYEGYKAYAEAALIAVVEHDRRDWRQVAETLPDTEWFFLSQPSAIDGNVWPDANSFLELLSARSGPPRVIMDLTYVGAIAQAPAERIAVGLPCVRDVVISLSKPFGVYYDRIGGVFCRRLDLGLFGNKWFKSLTALQLGVALMQRHDVFALPRRYAEVQRRQAAMAGQSLGLELVPSDVYLLATAAAEQHTNSALADYLRRIPSDRSTRLRLCLTPGMAAQIGTAGPVQAAEGIASKRSA
jgi:hypothetical protein